MKKCRNILVILIVSLGTIIPAAGQDSLAIRLIASAYNDSIVLRWASSSPLAWKLLNEYGYRLERYTIIRDSVVLDEKPLKVIGNPIKPASSAQWLQHMNNEYVAIAAQAIFGEDFQVSGKSSNSLAEVVQKSQELEMRYSFALLAADVSPLAADLSGLRLVDKELKTNEKYLYRVYSLVPEDIMKIDFGYTFLGPDEIRPLPVPLSPEIRRMENTVVLQWDTHTHMKIYTGYFVEKSIDGGKTFKRLTALPIVNIATQETLKNENSFSMKTDSIEGDIDQIQYVVRGITAFGEIGPPSEISIITDEKPLTATPSIINATIADNATVELKWSFSEAHQSEIRGFRVERRTKLEEGYETVQPEVQPSDRSYVDNSPYGTNYYRIVAFTPKGQQNASFPYMIQLEDSIPPSPPANLTGAIDSVGTIVLRWDSNSERDLIGYRVYRSSFRNAEFSQITVSPVEENIFYDTVNIRTLTRKVYYKIAAVDNRFNTSSFSATFELVLPDVIPPVPPVIKSVTSKEGGVEIRWIPSSSEDVAVHRVYRKHQYSTSWELVKELTKEDSCCYYFDEVHSIHRYQYAFQAADENGLKSAMTKPVWGSPLPVSSRDKVKDVVALPDRTKKVVSLKWTYQATPEKFLIYRSTNDEPLSLYKSVQGSSKEFNDSNLQLNANYEYRIKAVFRDGSESPFSDRITVAY